MKLKRRLLSMNLIPSKSYWSNFTVTQQVERTNEKEKIERKTFNRWLHWYKLGLKSEPNFEIKIRKSAQHLKK
jgi:L-rhamnose isomerase